MTRATIALAALAALAACNKERTCSSGEALCDGVCTSVEIDSNNCGACGAACGPYQECNAGTCECGPATESCGDACADLSTSAANCGACGNACGALACEGGTCVSSCSTGLANCSGSCVVLSADRWNCGACGSACRRGESCRDGQCRPDLYVACFATDDVRPANAALRTGLPRKAGDGPIALAIAGPSLYAANSLSHSISSFDLDLSYSHEYLLGGSDFEGLAEHGGRLFVSNAGPGALIAWDPGLARVVDEVALGDLSGVNPRGIAFVGDRAYVALYGTNPSSGGQEVVAVDFSGLAACVTPPCAEVVSRISVTGGADAGGLPFPSAAAVVGAKVYVTLSNLKLGQYGYYTDPAGNGKLAVIDSAAGDALTLVDLGAACTNPGALAVRGEVVWVSCGGTGNLLPVDVSGASPVLGAPVSLAVAGVYVPGKLAFCGGTGYVTDQWSGTLVRFDPAGLAGLASGVVCPNSDAGWAWAADVLCAP